MYRKYLPQFIRKLLFRLKNYSKLETLKKLIKSRVSNVELKKLFLDQA